MIPTLFFGGTVLLTLSWTVGLFMLWRGRPKLTLGSCGLCMLLGVGTASATMFGPRNSDFLYGDLHRGDGFGLIGLIIFGAAAAGIALVVLMLTALLGAARKNSLREKASA